VDVGPAPPSQTSNVEVSNFTTAPTHTLPGRDSLTETLGVAEGATSSTKYSKRLSFKFRFGPHFSFV
jgi:hypothetical protein